MTDTNTLVGQQNHLPLAITSAPERIWLDLGFNPYEEDAHFSNLHDLTWSQDNATGDGIEYVRADRAAPVDATVQRDAAIEMLADWVNAVNTNGTGWDDWDEHFKDAAFRPGPLRELLDEAIAARAAQGAKHD